MLRCPAIRSEMRAFCRFVAPSRWNRHLCQTRWIETFSLYATLYSVESRWRKVSIPVKWEVRLLFFATLNWGLASLDQLVGRRLTTRSTLLHHRHHGAKFQICRLLAPVLSRRGYGRQWPIRVSDHWWLRPFSEGSALAPPLVIRWSDGISDLSATVIPFLPNQLIYRAYEVLLPSLEFVAIARQFPISHCELENWRLRLLGVVGETILDTIRVPFCRPTLLTEKEFRTTF